MALDSQSKLDPDAIQGLEELANPLQEFKHNPCSQHPTFTITDPPSGEETQKRMEERVKSELDGIKVSFPMAHDLVNYPSHYTHGPIEFTDAIQSMLTPEEFRGYLKGVLVGYVWRERFKGGEEDIHKAHWYVRRLMELGKGGLE